MLKATFPQARGRDAGRDVSREVLARPSGVPQLWAVIGVALIALALNNWLRWAASPGFVQPDPGPDPYPYLWVLRATEFVSSAIFVFLLWITLLGPLLRRRTITLDGKLFLGGLFASTLDVMYGIYNPTWAMNAHAISMGTWSRFFPGYSSPAMEDNAWGLLWCLPAYIWLGVGSAIVGCWLLNRLRAAFPSMSTVSAYLIVLITFDVIFAALAMFWNRTEVYTYLSGIEGLTLWYGETYQLPLTEPLWIAVYCIGYTWLRDSIDDRGHCAVDRHLARASLGKGAKVVTSTLAVIGFCGAVTVFGYQVPNAWFAMKGDSHPALPSYLQPGLWCGQPDKPLCAGQYLKEQRERYYDGRGTIAHSTAGIPDDQAGQRLDHRGQVRSGTGAGGAPGGR